VPVVLELTLRRLVCGNYDCPQQTFHEQIPGLAERYGRRTPPLALLVAGFAIALAGRAASALLATSGGGVVVHRGAGRVDGAARPVRSAPEAIGVDDFALKRCPH
jgi:hypothetical protein